eukprot:4893284-Pyramimonas_sp.AAC.1
MTPESASISMPVNSCSPPAGSNPLARQTSALQRSQDLGALQVDTGLLLPENAHVVHIDSGLSG